MKCNKMLIVLISTFILLSMLQPITVGATSKSTKDKKETVVVETTVDSSHKFEVNGVSVVIDYGFNNMVKRQCYMPVNVVLSSGDTNFEGYVQIGVAESDGGTVYQEKVNLQAGKPGKVAFNIPVNTKSGKMECFLLDREKEVLKKDSLDIKVHNKDSVLIGMLTDNVDDIKFLTPDSQSDIIVKLDNETFPNDYRALESLNMIIVNDYDTSRLSDAQYSALKNWINAGGMLVIGTGSNAEKVLKRFDDSYLSINIGSTSNEEISFSEGNKDEINKAVLKKMSSDGIDIATDSKAWKDFWSKYRSNQFSMIDDAKPGTDEEKENTIYQYVEREKSNWIKRNVVNLSIANAITVLNSNDNKLMQLVSKNKGKVCIFEIDLAIEEEHLEARGKLCDILAKYSDNNSKKGEKVEKYLSSILQSSRTKMPIASKYIKFLIAYLMILVGLYIFLRKKSLRSYIWVAIPAIAVVFCIVMHLASLGTRISKPLSTFFSVVKLTDSEVASEDLYFNYLIADRDEKTMRINKDYNVYSKALSGELSEEDMLGNKGYSVYVENEEEATNLTIKGLSIFSTKNFNATKSFKTKSNMDVKLSGFNDSFAGSVTNNVGEDLKYVSVIMPNYVIYIGDIKNGETKQIDQNTLNRSYNSKANICYALYSVMGKDRDNATNCVDSKGNVTSIGFARATEYFMLSNDFATDSSGYVLGISNKDSELIENLSVEASGLSLYTKGIAINYKNSSGQEYVPDIRNKLNFGNGSSDIVYDSTEDTWKIQGISADAEFDLGSSGVITSLTVSSEVNRVYEDEKTINPVFDGKISLYNYRTKQYEQIYSSGDEVTKKDMSPYTESGSKVLIRFEANNQDVSYIPSISITKSSN